MEVSDRYMKSIRYFDEDVTGHTGSLDTWMSRKVLQRDLRLSASCFPALTPEYAHMVANSSYGKLKDDCDGC